MNKCVGLLVSILLGGVLAAQESASPPPVVDIPAERVDIPLGAPLSARALVTKPVPITGVVSWSLESRRHRGNMWCHALSPDGRHLATGGLDGTIRIWEVDSGRLVRALIGHNSYVSHLDWSPDGNTLASAGTYDSTVRLWDTRSGRPLRVLKGHPAEVTLVKWAPHGRTVLAAGGVSGALSAWDVISGKKRSTIELGRSLHGLSWQPDGNGVAIAAMTVQIWDPDKNKVARSVGEVKETYLSVAWAPDGKRLAAGTAKETTIFDGATGKALKTLASPGSALLWVKAGKQLATLGPDSIKLWDSETGNLLTTIPGVSARSFGASPDATKFISANATAFSVHDAMSGKVIRTFDNLSGTAGAWWLGSKLFVTGLGTAKLSLWDGDTGKRLRVLEGHTAAIAAVALSPGGKTIATAGHDKSVRLWDVATGNLLQTFAEHGAPVLAVAFASDGKLLASSSADKQIQVWEAATAKVQQTLTGSQNTTALAWKPGTTISLLANSKEESVQIWNARTGKAEKTLEANHHIVSLAWSPDGTRIATGQANGEARIWQASSAKQIHHFEQQGSPPQVSSLAWSPSGALLAAGRGNHTMQLWDPKSGKQLFSLQTMAPAERVSWTPASSTVAVTSQERTVRFVDAASGKLRGLVLTEDDQLIAVGFDGHYRAPSAESDLLYVLQTRNSQDTYTPSQFAGKFALKNTPARVSLAGK
jgi:WD40 repeat protein